MLIVWVLLQTSGLGGDLRLDESSLTSRIFCSVVSSACLARIYPSSGHSLPEIRLLFLDMRLLDPMLLALAEEHLLAPVDPDLPLPKSLSWSSHGVED